MIFFANLLIFAAVCQASYSLYKYSKRLYGNKKAWFIIVALNTLWAIAYSIASPGKGIWEMNWLLIIPITYMTCFALCFMLKIVSTWFIPKEEIHDLPQEFIPKGSGALFGSGPMLVVRINPGDPRQTDIIKALITEHVLNLETPAEFEQRMQGNDPDDEPT